MVYWETGDPGDIVQPPVRVNGSGPGHAFLRQTAEHHAQEVLPKHNSVALKTVQVFVLSYFILFDKVNEIFYQM